MPNASIMLRERDLFVASHQFWVLCVGDEPISELNGMATDRDTNETKMIGSNNDLLKVWEYNTDGRESSLGRYSISDTGLYQPNQFCTIKLSGDFETIIKPRWECAIQAAKKINEQQIQYHVVASYRQDAFLNAFNIFMNANAAVIASDDQDLSVGNSNSVARTLGEVMGFDPINISGRLVSGQEKNLLPKEIYPDLYEYSDSFLRNSSIPRNLCCI